MKAFWTARALLRLQQIHDRIALDQPLNARRFVDRLTGKVAEIAQDPLGGRVVSQYRRDDIRETFEGSYRIIYRVLPDRVDILTVRHGARLLPSRTRNL
jgi:toxin ParE1/3/4